MVNDGSGHDPVAVFDATTKSLDAVRDALREELTQIATQRDELDAREGAILARLGEKKKRGRKRGRPRGATTKPKAEPKPAKVAKRGLGPAGKIKPAEKSVLPGEKSA